jgi:cytochrome c553
MPLAHAGDPAVEQIASTCEACHGPHGQSSNPTLPSLGGQTSQYIYEQLRDFGAGRRQSTTMTPLAKTLSSDDMQKLADYFGQQPPMPTALRSIPPRSQGRSIADNCMRNVSEADSRGTDSAYCRPAIRVYRQSTHELATGGDERRRRDAGRARPSDQDLDALAQYVANLN